ncbi:hypothetical protein FQN57_004486 [Myotisia sp. PD_48]|nr:hypothetical protein FQN57_004486 [Myotisia sp. PD_48]
MAIRISIPPVTRGILSIICAFSFLHGVARWRQISEGGLSAPVPYLSLVPAQFIVYPWTLLTATFVEQNIFTVLINGATIFYGGKYLERAWGSREFGKFILIIALTSNTVMAFLYIVTYAIRPHPGISNKGISGGVAIQAAFLVAFKQLVPEHTVTILRGIVKMRVKHFPALFLLFNAIGGLLLGTDVAFHLSWLGVLISWTFLRFYKRQPDLSGTSTTRLGLKGDASETFAFACFFPDAIQPPIAFISDSIFTILVSIRVCTPFSADDIACGNEQALARGEAGLPSLLNNVGRGGAKSGKREEAERRRAIALKALDQRLQTASASRSQQVQSPPQQSQPSLPTPAAPAVANGQSMLGQTNYTPDHE